MSLFKFTGWECLSQHLNATELMPELIQQGILDAKDRVAIMDKPKSERPQELLHRTYSRRLASPETILKFCLCLWRENKHLGHRHAAALLQGQDVFSSQSAVLSKHIKECIIKIEPKLQELLNLEELQTYLVKYELCTQSEIDAYVVNQLRERSERIQYLLGILDTKGPDAYLLFLKCLSEEKEHLGHVELYEKILQVSQLDHTAVALCEPRIVKPMPHIKLAGRLHGRKYDQLMKLIQTYQYNLQWKSLMTFTRKLIQSSYTDFKVLGMLTRATGHVYKGNEARAISLVKRAIGMCTKVGCANGKILEGRCYYVLSALHRNYGRYESAHEYLYFAAQTFINVAPGEDTSIFFYQSASQHALQNHRKEAEEAFSTAIEHSEMHSSGLPVIHARSCVGNALLCLGSSRYEINTLVQPSRDDMVKADHLLRRIDVAKLPKKVKIEYYVAKASLCNWNDQKELALKYAQCAVKYNKQFAGDARTTAEKLLSTLMHGSP